MKLDDKLDEALKETFPASDPFAISPYLGKAELISLLNELLEAERAGAHRAQGWVVRKLRDALPRIEDANLRAELREMLATHVSNTETTP